MPIIGEIIAMDRRGLLMLPGHPGDPMGPGPALDELPAEYRKEAESPIEAAEKKVRDEAEKSDKDRLFDRAAPPSPRDRPLV